MRFGIFPCSARGYSGACLSNFLINCTAGTLFLFNTCLQKGHGLTLFEAGLKTLGFWVAVLTMVRIGEKILRKVGYKKPMIGGVLACISGLIRLSFTLVGYETYMIQSVAAFALFGVGSGCYATASTDCAMVNAPLEKAGVAADVYKKWSARWVHLSVSRRRPPYLVSCNRRHTRSSTVDFG